MTKEERADILNHWSVGPLGESGEWEEQKSQVFPDLGRFELKLEDCRAGRDVNLRVITHWLRYLVAPPSHAPSFLPRLPTPHPPPPSKRSVCLKSRSIESGKVGIRERRQSPSHDQIVLSFQPPPIWETGSSSSSVLTPRCSSFSLGNRTCRCRED